MKGQNFNFQATTSLTFSSAEVGEQERAVCSPCFLTAAGAQRDPPLRAGHGNLLIGPDKFGWEVFICAEGSDPGGNCL